MGWLKYGAWGAAGLLAGIALVIWVGPRTPEGAGVLVVVCCLVAVLLRGMLRATGLINRD